MDTTYRTATNVGLGLLFVTGLALTAYLIGFTAVTVMNTAAWLVAVTLGVSLRRRRTAGS
jgi:hypothetical protein